MATIAPLRHGTPSVQDHRIGCSRSSGFSVQDHRNTQPETPAHYEMPGSRFAGRLGSMRHVWLVSLSNLPLRRRRADTLLSFDRKRGSTG
jgi:hypothetical protein